MNPTSLAPWDALPYYQTPSVSVVSCGAGLTRILQGDPMRVFFAVAINLGGGFQVTPNATAGASEGMLLNSQTPVQVFHRDVWGPFLALEWFVNSAGAQNVTVYAVSMAKWPGGGNGRSGEKAAAVAPGSAYSYGRDWFNRNRRPQPAAIRAAN